MWADPGHYRVSVCTRQRSSTVIARHICHLQMPHGVKQACPLIPTLFGLYVDGLELLILVGVMVPLLLYADDLILMSEMAAGLQQQLDALASFW